MRQHVETRADDGHPYCRVCGVDLDSPDDYDSECAGYWLLVESMR